MTKPAWWWTEIKRRGACQDAICYATRIERILRTSQRLHRRITYLENQLTKALRAKRKR